MLFFGNIVKNSDNYQELTDCALRIVPSVYLKNDFESIKWDYTSPNGQYAYYNSKIYMIMQGTLIRNIIDLEQYLFIKMEPFLMYIILQDVN